MSSRQRCERGKALVARSVAVRDVVDGAAEGVDRVHRLAPRPRQDAHGEVERAAGCRQRRRGIVGRSRRRPHSCGAARCDLQPGRGSSAGRGRRRRRRERRSAKPGRPRCTRSLKGSRRRRPSARAAASRWMAAISSPRRVSATRQARGAPSASRPCVRSASSARQARKAGVARSAPSARPRRRAPPAGRAADRRDRGPGNHWPQSWR